MNQKINTEFSNKLGLVLISFLVLFLELLFIRWLPSNILSLWYFSNIVLISSFLGIGVGAIISKKVSDLFKWFPVVLLLSVLFYISLRWLEVIIPSEGGEWLWNFHYRGNNFGNIDLSLNIYATLALVFVINAVVFTFLGQKVGLLMSEFKAEKAYGLDLLGAILGVVLFGLMTMIGGWFGHPILWFVIVGVVTLYFIKNDNKFFTIGIICTLIMIASVFVSSKNETWSPYYSIKTKNAEEGGVQVYVNRFFFQHALDFNNNLKAKWKYLLPYHFSLPNDLLILGAGSGNDVATANSVNVPNIDAVEIDPKVYEIGVNSHPAKPYQNPNVTVYIDDARTFLKKTDKKYDMIILGTLDSHALLSAMSTVRLDNFVYTVESLEDIKSHLSERGIAVLKFSAPNEEFALRLLRIASVAFSDVPSVAYWGDNSLFNVAFLAGPGLTQKEIDSLDTNLFTRVNVPSSINEPSLPSDDWPYLYLKSRNIPSPYLKAVGILVSIAFVMIFIFLRKRKDILSLTSLNFFVLGSAFLLLETKIITSLSLLFGSTWSVNAFVFGSILTMLYLANLFVSKKEIKNITVVYVLLGLSLLLNYVLPPDYFLGMSYWLRGLLSTSVATLPIFFSAIIFSYTFKQVSKENIGSMYGVNLAGAVFGGFLEYSSMVFGLKSMYIIAAGLYLVSFLVDYFKK